MAKDLSDVAVSEDALSPEQERLMMWRDYFQLLHEAYDGKEMGRNNHDDDDVAEVCAWLSVIISELESDVMHLECGQEKYCRWGDAKDLSAIDGNIRV